MKKYNVPNPPKIYCGTSSLLWWFPTLKKIFYYSDHFISHVDFNNTSAICAGICILYECNAVCCESWLVGRTNCTHMVLLISSATCLKAKQLCFENRNYFLFCWASFKEGVLCDFLLQKRLWEGWKTKLPKFVLLININGTNHWDNVIIMQRFWLCRVHAL